MATAIIAALGVAWSPAADAHPGATEELQQLDARVREDPENAALRVRYADAATRAGDLHRALTQARMLARLAPEEREVHRIRGEVWLARKRPKNAEREFTQYLSDGVLNAGSGTRGRGEPTRRVPGCAGTPGNLSWRGRTTTPPFP